MKAYITIISIFFCMVVNIAVVTAVLTIANCVMWGFWAALVLMEGKQKSGIDYNFSYHYTGH